MEGKKKYFALVLFLFLGLMIFTFANPVEEEKEFIDGDNEQSEKVENNKDKNKQENNNSEEQEEPTTGQQNILNNVTNNTNNTNNNNDNTQNREEDYLGKALAAVEKAEASYTKEDVEAAKELVNNVTDATEKGKLQNRLEEVDAGIAVLELLEQLEKQVEEAITKADMTTAKTFRDENEIAEKIEALTNKTVADELQKRLEEVSKLLDDNKAPVINVEEKAYQENVTVSAEDEEGNNFKLYLRKDSEEEKEIENNTLTTSEGIYVVRAIDEAFNESDPIRFIVDWTDPVFKNLTNGGHYKDVTIDVEDLSKVVIKVTNMDKAETTEVENGTKLTDEATYKLEATDEAGNKTTYYVAIDKTKPAISTTDKSIINYTKWTEVTDKFLTLVKIKREAPNGEVTEETFTRANFEVGARNENFKFRYKLKEEGNYTIYAEDKYGNYKEETVTVDKTAAKKNAVNINVTGYKNDVNEQYATNGNKISAYISINEELKENPTFTFFANGKEIKVVKDEVVKSNSSNKDYPYVYTATLEINESLVAEDGLVTFTVTNIIDKAGNKTADITKTTTKKVITLDRTAPKAKYVAILSNKTADYKYAKNGDIIRFLVGMSEEIVLNDNFTVTLGDKTLKFVRSQGSGYEYIVDYKIPEDEKTLTEGELTFLIQGYADKAGNIGENLTTATHKTYNKVIYDRTFAGIKSINMYSNGNKYKEGEYDVYYTTNGQTITAYIRVKEQLKEAPKFTFEVAGKKYISTKVEEGFHNKDDKTAGIYRYQTTVKVDEFDPEDGDVKIIVSDIYDKASNKAADVTGLQAKRITRIDRTAAKKNAVNINVIGYKNEVNEQYATNGNTISAYISLNEELKENPEFTFYANGKKIKVMKDEVVKSNSSNQKYPHVYTANLEITKELVAEDGLVTFTVANLVDKAGNKTEDITKTTTPKVITLDRTAAKRVYSTIRSNRTAEVQANGKDIDYYHKNGTEFEYAISFNELLKEVPTVTIGGKNLEMKLNEKVLKEENKFLYEGTFKVAEDETELTEGVLEIKVTNVKDLAGNETVLGEQTKTSNGRRVIYDRTKPEGQVTSSNNNGLAPTNKDVVATLKTEEYVNTPEGWTTVVEGFEFTRVYTTNVKTSVKVTDKAGNESTIKFEIKRIDKVAPELTITEPEKYQLEVYSEYVDKGYSAYDKVDKDVTKLVKKVYEFQAKGEEEYKSVEGIDTSKLGIYKVTYTAYDKAGNTTVGIREVEIVDTTAPLITLNGEKTFTIEAGLETYEELGATVTDNYDETITNLQPSYIHYRDKDNKLEKVPAVDNKKVGQYKIVYEHTDSNGNIGVDSANHEWAMRVVYVKDTTAPVVTTKQEKDITLEAGVDKYTELGAIVTDNLDETYEMDKPSYINYYTLDGKFVGREPEVDTTKLGKYLLVYMATDANGNVSNNQLPQSKKWVIVKDTINPTLKVKDESIGYDPYYSSISFKLSDSNKVDYVEVNGNKFDVSNAKYSDANYQNIKHYLVEGLNKVVLYDTAGNTTEKEFYMDWTVGTTKTADFYVNNAKDYNGVFYATNGKTVVANIATSEELGENPTFTFYNNNKAYPADKVEARGYDEANDKYYYQATLTINKDQKLVDGELTYIVTNIVDRGGNKMADVNEPSNVRKVYIDRTKPQLKVKPTSIANGPGYKKLDLQAIDNNMSHVIINGKKHDRTSKYVDINDGDMQKYLVGENTITAVDKAGNETTKTFVIDYNFYVTNMDELKAAFANGGTAIILNDIEVTEMLTLKDGKELILNMNEKKLTINETTDPMMDIKSGTKITITGNGTFDLEDHKYATLMYPRGEVIIQNGKFLRASGTNKKEYGSFFVGISGSGGAAKIRIYDGYFDGGYYVEGDEFNNSRTMLNGSWGQDIKIYGGTFVGQNPAYGDEGMAYTNPEHAGKPEDQTYCQTIFFEGQSRLDTEIPSTYKVEKGQLEDGRPTFKVIYTPAE